MVGFAHLPRRIAVRASAALNAKADVSFHSAAMSVVGEAVAVKSAEGGGRGRLLFALPLLWKPPLTSCSESHAGHRGAGSEVPNVAVSGEIRMSLPPPGLWLQGHLDT